VLVLAVVVVRVGDVGFFLAMLRFNLLGVF